MRSRWKHKLADPLMTTSPLSRAKLALFITPLAFAACTDHPADNRLQPNKTEASTERIGSCKLPPLAVNVGAQLDGAWGVNAPGAFPFTKGGPEPEPGNVALSLELNFKLSGATPTLVSITGGTPAGDKVFLPALVNKPVVYTPPPGGYTDTPTQYRETGCDSVWSPQGSTGALATQNPDGSYKAQCATFAMDVIPVAFTINGDSFSADLANPALSSFSDSGKTGWIDPNTGQVMVDGKAYSRVTRGWELAARLQDDGVAKFTADQVPWQDNQVGHVTAELVKLQLAKFGGTASNSGSDYTYRTDAYNHAGKWMFSHGHYSVGTPKSGPGRLSAGVAMFSIDGVVSQDKKTINVKSFSYSGPMLVCPANGHECTASPGRSFTGLSCSVTL